MPDRLRVDGSAWIAHAVLILLLPLRWVFAAMAAAAFHEFCHIWMLRHCLVPVYELRVGARGAVLETGPVTWKQEFLCALAGPVGSFSLLLLVHIFPRLALCALAQGLYNLIPVGNLDGARVLRCGIRLLPRKKPLQSGERKGTIVLP